jgi:hypothetical protein
MRYRLETAGVITDASHCAKLDAEIADRETLRAAAWKARALEDRLSQLAGGTYVSAGPLRDTALGRVSVAEIAGLTGHEAGNVERALRLSELL